MSMYNICVHLIVKLSPVADHIISFQVEDWSRIFEQLLFHFVYEKTNKTKPDLLSRLLASDFEGKESKATGEL